MRWHTRTADAANHSRRGAADLRYQRRAFHWNRGGRSYRREGRAGTRSANGGVVRHRRCIERRADVQA
jgi:hypothetical protein